MWCGCHHRDWSSWSHHWYWCRRDHRSLYRGDHRSLHRSQHGRKYRGDHGSLCLGDEVLLTRSHHGGEAGGERGRVGCGHPGHDGGVQDWLGRRGGDQLVRSVALLSQRDRGGAGRGWRGLSSEYRDVRLERLVRAQAGAGRHHGGGCRDQRGGGNIDGLLCWCWRIFLVRGYPVQVAVSDTAAQGPLASPGSVGRDGDLATVVGLRVVDVQLERPPLVSLYQTEEVLTLVEDAVRS